MARSAVSDEGRTKRMRAARKEPDGTGPPPWGDRRLVVLEGGGRDGWWYFEDDAKQQALAAERMGNKWPYEATVRTRGHPHYVAIGTVYTYVPDPVKV